MMKNKKFLAGFVIAIGSFVSLITSVVMFAKKRKELGGFFLGLGVVAGAVGSFMQFEGRSADFSPTNATAVIPIVRIAAAKNPKIRKTAISTRASFSQETRKPNNFIL